VTRYESGELAEQYPMYDGLERFDFAVSDDSAAYSDGTDAANGFARAAADAGATVVTGVGAESIAVEDGAVVGVDTEDGRVDCEDVVVAGPNRAHRRRERSVDRRHGSSRRTAATCRAG